MGRELAPRRAAAQLPQGSSTHRTAAGTLRAMTNTITSVVDTYIAAWNEPDASRRRELVAETFTDDGTYLDPLMAGAGVDEIAAMIGAAQAQFPGHSFALSFGPDAHNDVVRFAWTLNGAG